MRRAHAEAAFYSTLVILFALLVGIVVTADPDVQVKRVPVPGPTATRSVAVPVPGPTVTKTVTKRVIVRKTVTARAARAVRSQAQGSTRDLGRAAVRAQGWSSGQWSCLDSLWAKESGWRASADNPTSTAYGVAQFLDSTWAGTGIAKTSDPARQIKAGLRYVKSRYGTPCSAWGHSVRTGWY